jgi:hypothetical protein
MESDSEPFAISGEVAAETCESCGRHPAVLLTVRRHVGLIYLQRFVTVQALACRACGRRLVRDFTLRTLVQGWWGAISFFFNWFVLGTNAVAWLKLRRLAEPTISGTDGLAPAPGPSVWDGNHEKAAEPKKKTPILVKVGAVLVLGFALLGLASWSWDSTHHDHPGPHGQPISALEVKRELTGKMFLTDAGGRFWVESADCTAAGGMAVRDTHFRCQLVYDNGQAEEVTVHALPEELFFDATLAGGA